MSELKYKVGDKAGPFEIVELDLQDQFLPYRIQKDWFSVEMTESIFDHYAKSEFLEKKAESNRKKAAYWKDKFADLNKAFESGKIDLETTNKYWTILKKNHKILEESNIELRKSKESIVAQFNEVSAAIGHLRISNESLTSRLTKETESRELLEEGIATLESDAKANRTEIALLKSDFETKNAELEILEENYNCLKDILKYTKVVGWVGWIFFFIALLGLIFFKGN